MTSNVPKWSAADRPSEVSFINLCTSCKWWCTSFFSKIDSGINIFLQKQSQDLWRHPGEQLNGLSGPSASSFVLKFLDWDLNPIILTQNKSFRNWAMSKVYSNCCANRFCSLVLFWVKYIALIYQSNLLVSQLEDGLGTAAIFLFELLAACISCVTHNTDGFQ